MDFAVAYVMQKNSRAAFPAFQLGDQMMQTLRCVGWNGTATERADRVGLLCVY